MELTSVTKVEVLQRSVKVNEFLDLGWKLLDTYKTAYDTEGPGVNHQTMNYVLGWVGDNPKYPPENMPSNLSGCTVL